MPDNKDNRKWLSLMEPMINDSYYVAEYMKACELISRMLYDNKADVAGFMTNYKGKIIQVEFEVKSIKDIK